MQSNVFPALVQPNINSVIHIVPYFNTEGLEQQLIFTIENGQERVNANTVWNINLPIYYSQLIWNEEFMIYCMIDNVRV